MEEPCLLVADDDGVRTLTLNRPRSLNSFTGAMHAELLAALEAAALDQTVRCVVLTGTGRGFCAGQDLADPSIAPEGGIGAPGAEPPDIGQTIERYYRPLALRLRSMPVPVIAAVNGIAAGAGANVALCCDIVVAARSARFVQAFSKIGLIPDCGGTWLLPRLVGRGQAMALAMLGDKIEAEHAQRLGLVWDVYDDATFPADVAALAGRLAALPTRALAATREAIDAAQDLTFAEALDREAQVQRDLGRAHDFAEGVAAFMARRAAVYSDR